MVSSRRMPRAGAPNSLDRDRAALPMRRVVVVGSAGCGKTHLAAELAGLLRVPHIEMDALNWGPNWTSVGGERLRELVAVPTAGEGWVADGNYSETRDIVWGRADTLVWLDYPLPLIYWRLLTRTVRRCVTGEELWNGNRETVRACFLDEDNLFAYVRRTHARRKREYERLSTSFEFPHLHWYRLRSPREARALLRAVRSGVACG